VLNPGNAGSLSCALPIYRPWRTFHIIDVTVAMPRGENNFFITSFQALRRWEEQQGEFVRLRRGHEMDMIAMEAQEVDRREDEVRRRIEEFNEQKRKNR
jgi:hypothetical protein